MMKRNNICTYISILAFSLLIAIPQQASAQRRKTVEKVKADTIPFFRGVTVGADLVGPARRLLGDYGQYEAMAQVNLKDRYFPVVEAGVGQADKTDETTGIRFKTNAPFGRIGCDFNILKDKHDVYRLLIGGRLGFSSFKYDVSSKDTTDPVWGGKVEFGATGVSATYLWGEIVGGVNAKIWGPLHLGWTVRYKANIHKKHGEIGEPWYIPGYGRSGSSRLDATFNVMLEF